MNRIFLIKIITTIIVLILLALSYWEIIDTLTYSVLMVGVITGFWVLIKKKKQER